MAKLVATDDGRNRPVASAHRVDRIESDRVARGSAGHGDRRRFHLGRRAGSFRTRIKRVTFQLTGGGRILGVGNGNPADHDTDQADQRKPSMATASSSFKPVLTPRRSSSPKPLRNLFRIIWNLRDVYWGGHVRFRNRSGVTIT